MYWKKTYQEKNSKNLTSLLSQLSLGHYRRRHFTATFPMTSSHHGQVCCCNHIFFSFKTLAINYKIRTYLNYWGSTLPFDLRLASVLGTHIVDICFDCRLIGTRMVIFELRLKVRVDVFKSLSSSSCGIHWIVARWHSTGKILPYNYLELCTYIFYA